MNRLFTYATTILATSLTVATAALADGPPPPPPTVPEPGTLILLGAGAAGLLIYKKIKK